MRSAGTQTVEKPEQVVDVRPEPRFRVILHNDDKNTFEHVIRTLCELFRFSIPEATSKAFEAHHTGCSLLVVVHRERAELYVDQLAACSLSATMEPDD